MPLASFFSRFATEQDSSLLFASYLGLSFLRSLAKKSEDAHRVPNGEAPKLNVPQRGGREEDGKRQTTVGEKEEGNKSH